jgi:hypothetical protein
LADVNTRSARHLRGHRAGSIVAATIRSFSDIDQRRHPED